MPAAFALAGFAQNVACTPVCCAYMPFRVHSARQVARQHVFHRPGLYRQPRNRARCWDADDCTLKVMIAHRNDMGDNIQVLIITLTGRGKRLYWARSVRCRGVLDWWPVPPVAREEMFPSAACHNELGLASTSRELSTDTV